MKASTITVDEAKTTEKTTILFHHRDLGPQFLQEAWQLDKPLYGPLTALRIPMTQD